MLLTAYLRLQGDSVAQALEAVLKTSHINLMKNIRTGVGSQMMMQSAIFGRLGMPSLNRSIRLAQD